jgi:tRNA-Thr(GGU) m(6)t(6)A37 methyltransferase TsaA
MKPEETEYPTLTLRPIGVIRSPHRQADRTPIQPVYAEGIKGRAEIHSEYVDGLRDLEGFSHICLIYWFHRASAPRLIVKPFLEDVPRGVFATRAPCRPNPIGLSVVRLIRRVENVLHLEDLDILDGTPLLDIKPYVSRFEYREVTRCGWQDNVDEEEAQIRGRRGFQEDGQGE